MNKRLFLVSADILFLTISFLFFAWIKPATAAVVLPKYIKPFVFFLLIWIIASLTAKKYVPQKFMNRREIFYIILQSNFASLAVVAILIYTFKLFSVSRSLLYGTIVATTCLEILAAWMYNSVLTSQEILLENGFLKTRRGSVPYAETLTRPAPKKPKAKPDQRAHALEYLRVIGVEYGEEVKEMISNYLLEASGPIQVVSTTTRFNIAALPESKYDCLVNLHKINDIRWMNKFFETVNEKLFDEGIFIGKAETYSLRKQRILRKYILPLNYVIYTFDFIFRRVFPKLPILKQMYFSITKGRNRVISRAETLGRLCSCGFDILEERYIGDELYFVVKKTGEPFYPENPTYGPLVKLKRIGKGGRFFNVYKMRTMHPYSEYIQQYVYQMNDLEEGGKFKDDFRVSTLGKFLRKFWLDELPMLINVLKREMKIVGVRPLSNHYYNMYSDEMKQLRVKFKPGLVPPYYADLPKTLDQIMESEKKYLEAYEKNPFTTDMKYFFLAFKNILFKNARSR